MKKFKAGAMLLLAASLATAACTKHDETTNTVTTNETITTDETTNIGAPEGNLSADTVGNLPDAASENATAAPANAL